MAVRPRYTKGAAQLCKRHEAAARPQGKRSPGLLGSLMCGGREGSGKGSEKPGLWGGFCMDHECGRSPRRTRRGRRRCGGGEGRDDNFFQYIELEVCMAQPTIQQAAEYMGTEYRREWGWSRVV